MKHVVALVALILWIASNFFLWGQKQPPHIVFWEALGLGAPAFIALFYFVKTSAK